MGFLGSGAILTVMADKLANKLRLDRPLTERRIIVTNRNSGCCAESKSRIPVSFSSIVIRFDFLINY